MSKSGDSRWGCLQSLGSLLVGIAAIITALVGVYTVIQGQNRPPTAVATDRSSGSPSAQEGGGGSQTEGGEGASEPVPDEDEPVGCFVETSMLTMAHIEPDPFSTTRGRFPQNKRYPVLTVQSYQHGTLTTIYFFEIDDPETNLRGWAEDRHLDFIAEECLP